MMRFHNLPKPPFESESLQLTHTLILDDKTTSGVCVCVCVCVCAHSGRQQGEEEKKKKRKKKRERPRLSCRHVM